MSQKVTLVGGGLAGSLLAIFLAKKGFKVTIYEKRPDMRGNDYEGGRSINLAMSERGLRALRKLGLEKDILDIGIPMLGRMIHGEEGQLKYQPYGHNDQAIHSVSRGLLNVKLLQMADSMENIDMHFDHDCTEANLYTGETYYTNKEGVAVHDQADWVIATDGAYSAIRGAFQRSGRFNYSQTYEEHGYKELEILPNAEGGFAMNKNCLHIWPRKSYMMIALPNPDATFTCTLFMPFNGDPGFDDLKTTEEVEKLFNSKFMDAVPMMPNYLKDFKENPVGSLVTMRCYPWVRGKSALLGDSAHAIVPFYGQGMNSCFEDCAALSDYLDQTNNNMAEALEMYQNSRVENGNAIADLALKNFVEMRDWVGQPEFLARKAIEHELSELYAHEYKTQYELVTFADVSYKYAWDMGAKNDALINHIIEHKLEGKFTDRDYMLGLFKDYLS
jgi:kynurenine 3-monooxygenase